MNDRYLFRGKRTDNGEWVEGYYTLSIANKRHKNPKYQQALIWVENDGLYNIEVDPATVEPVAVKPTGNHKDTCPNCQKQNIKMQFYAVKTKNNYCPDCGQRIDWSEKGE